MDLSSLDPRQTSAEVQGHILAAILIPVTIGILGYCSGLSTSPENARLFLSALAGAQASVLAIVFSVTTIGIQLLSTRYSPRMSSLFTESLIFNYTFGLFVASIALDLILLLAVPESYHLLHTAGIAAASGLSLVVAVTLFTFVKAAIQRGTPDGAVDAFVTEMTPEKYLEELRDAATSQSEVAHPVRPVYNLIMNALSRGERVTAENALEQYGSLVTTVLKQLDDQGVFEKEDRQVVRKLFEPVLSEHLHDIALHAEEKGEVQIVRDAVEWQYKIGKEGLDRSIDTIPRQAKSGLSHVITHSPVESGPLFANNAAWKQIGQLLTDASKGPNPAVTRFILSSIDDDIKLQLWDVEDIRWYANAMTDLYRQMVETHENLLDCFGEDVAEVEMDWSHQDVPDDIEMYEEVTSLYSWKDSFCSTTSQFMRYLVEEGEYPIYGPAGIGKSTCVKHVLEKLENQGRVKTVYINCWQYNTRSSLLTQLLIELGYPAPRKGKPVDELLSKIREWLDKRKNVAVALDEFDQLDERTEVVYDLQLLNREAENRVGIVMISNWDPSSLTLDPRSRSRLNYQTLQFKPYNVGQLREILENRASRAFRSGSVSDEVLNEIAERVAEQSGDCREALEMLLRAGRKADSESCSKISTGLLEL
jgi:cell division control protein 6